jgi:site-specific recombinase XerD
MSDIVILDPNDLLANSRPSLDNAIQAWADATTDPGSSRRHDLLRDKARAVSSFFAFTGKRPDQVTTIDIKTWQAQLEAQGLENSTVYGMISRISSFYDWALRSPQLAGVLHFNPVTLARPKAPRPYQSESIKALDDDQARELLRIVRERSDLVGRRDYALLLIYMLTGMRRQEVISLRWGDVKIHEAGLVLTGKVKGGDIVTRELDSQLARDALLDYLRSSGRLDSMQPDSPLWTRHDPAGDPGQPLTSHAFAANLKRYAGIAGLGKIHLHQLRHTFARQVSEESGSLTTTQEELGHHNLATTRVYVQHLAIKRDRFSAAISERLKE